jgi:hypothetical protein
MSQQRCAAVGDAHSSICREKSSGNLQACHSRPQTLATACRGEEFAGERMDELDKSSIGEVGTFADAAGAAGAGDSAISADIS